MQTLINLAMAGLVALVILGPIAYSVQKNKVQKARRERQHDQLTVNFLNWLRGISRSSSALDNPRYQRAQERYGNELRAVESLEHFRRIVMSLECRIEMLEGYEVDQLGRKLTPMECDLLLYGSM